MLTWISVTPGLSTEAGPAVADAPGAPDVPVAGTVPRAVPVAEPRAGAGRRDGGRRPPGDVCGDLLLPVSALSLGVPPCCSPGTPIREVARLMRDEGRSAVLVEDPSLVGIITDADLRDRVLAAGASSETPASGIMTAPVRTVPAGMSAYEAALEMTSAGVRHLPIVDGHGAIVGEVTAERFLTLDEQGPLALHRAVMEAPDEETLAAAAGRLPALFCALVDAGLAAAAVSRVITVLHDALTRRLIDLAAERLGPPVAPFAWLALGSAARGEMSLVSDQDNALAYAGADDPEADAYFARFATIVNRGLAECGFEADISGVLAETDMWRLSEAGWRRLFERCLTEPNHCHLMQANIAFDMRQVAGELDLVPHLAGLMESAPQHPGFLASLAGTVTEIPSPLGFRRRLAGAVDVKKRGLVPIVNLARYFALQEGMVCPSTADRLERLEDSEVLAPKTVDGLRAAFATLSRVRMARHAELVRGGAEAGNVVDADELSRTSRAELTEALRVVADAQHLLPPPLRGW
jgi:CBS domain-containing protein